MGPPAPRAPASRFARALARRVHPRAAARLARPPSGAAARLARPRSSARLYGGGRRAGPFSVASALARARAR